MEEARENFMKPLSNGFFMHAATTILSGIDTFTQMKTQLKELAALYGYIYKKSFASEIGNKAIAMKMGFHPIPRPPKLSLYGGLFTYVYSYNISGIPWGYYMLQSGSRLKIVDIRENPICEISSYIITSDYILTTDEKDFFVLKNDLPVKEVFRTKKLSGEVFFSQNGNGFLLTIVNEEGIIFYRDNGQVKIHNIKIDESDILFADGRGLFLDEKYISFQGDIYPASFPKQFHKLTLYKARESGPNGIIMVPTVRGTYVCSSDKGTIRKICFLKERVIHEVAYFAVCKTGIYDIFTGNEIKGGKMMDPTRHHTCGGKFNIRCLTKHPDSGGYIIWLKPNNTDYHFKELINREYGHNFTGGLGNYPEIFFFNKSDYHIDINLRFLPFYTIYTLYPYFHYQMTGKEVKVLVIDPSFRGYFILHYGENGSALIPIDDIPQEDPSLLYDMQLFDMHWLGFIGDETYVMASKEEKLKILDAYIARHRK